MKKRLRTVIVAALVMMASHSVVADIIVGSWNIKHLGWGEHKQYDQVAHIAQSMDLIALQEVMSEEGLESLVSAMEHLSGEDWEYMASHAIGRGSYREQYAYVWRESRVEYTGGAVVYMDGNDVFSREPFLAEFQSKQSGQELAMANIHILYGDSVGDRLPEIQALDDIWEWMGEVYQGTPRVIAGDFNLKPSHPGWSDLANKGVVASIQKGATTLSSYDGHYANLYDNFWRKQGELDVTEAGIIRFPEVLGISHEVARKTVSDHAPIYMALGGSRLELMTFNGTAIVTTKAANPADQNYHSSCIELNSSSQEKLEQLPHIGPERAKTILEQGPWKGASSLQRINGIGPSRAQDIQNSGLLCQG